MGWLFAESGDAADATSTHTALSQAMQCGKLTMGTRIIEPWPSGAQSGVERTLAIMKRGRSIVGATVS